MEVREAIMETASISELPNNDYGYGIINIMNAINYDNQLKLEEPKFLPNDFNFSIFPNPFNPSVKINISGEKIAFLEINVYNINGVLIKDLYKINYIKEPLSLNWTPNKEGIVSIHHSYKCGQYIFIEKGNIYQIKSLGFPLP